jgi:integrase
VIPLALSRQCIDTSSLPEDERNALIVSSRNVDGQPVVVSRYGDPNWRLVNQPTNKQRSEQLVYFSRLPLQFRETMKSMVYRYMQRGREGQKRPGSRTVVKFVSDASSFLHHLINHNVAKLADATPSICAGYVAACRRHRVRREGHAKPMAVQAMVHCFAVVEAIFELSQFANDPMPEHPWPETSAAHMAGRTGAGTGSRRGLTPLMPDEVFTTLFRKSWSIVENGMRLLDVRDAWLVHASECGQNWDFSARHYQLTRFVKPRGWRTGGAFSSAVLELRTACYIIVASLSGCRNHELAFIQNGACFSTTGVSNDGTASIETYWWMRSRSTKTDAGNTEWMIPEAAVTALRIMERWAKPYQLRIAAEIEKRRLHNPRDPEIGEAMRHQAALFLTEPGVGRHVRTVSGQGWGIALKSFARSCGLQWKLASHQFRRKFANYAARSQFGDLRYLKEHFKHWSLDMTLGYALNESQEMELYAEIQGELDDMKTNCVDSWLQAGTPLAGGYGRNIVAWRGSNQITLFKDRRHMVRSLAESTPLRSNGHAWCTAQDNLCIGNDLEKTRCTGCRNAVIGLKHVPIYKGLHDHLAEVLKCDDIGRAGLTLVRRDMNRISNVLETLGQTVSNSDQHADS